MVKPVLTIKLEGTQIEEGRIPVDELVTVLRNIQLSVKRIGEVISKGASRNKKGRAKNYIEEEYGLDVVAFEPGSFMTGLVPHSSGQAQRHLIPSAGDDAIKLLVEGVKVVENEAQSFIRAFDFGVFSAISNAAQVLDRGVGQISLSYDGKAQERINAVIDQSVREHIELRLKGSVIPNHMISGILREVNFERETCQIFSAGEPINCTFDYPLKGEIIEAIETTVNAYGEAKVLGGTGRSFKIKELHIQELERVDERLADSFARPLSPMQTLLDAGAIKPLAGSEEIGDSVAYVRKMREGNYQ